MPKQKNCRIVVQKQSNHFLLLLIILHTDEKGLLPKAVNNTEQLVSNVSEQQTKPTQLKIIIYLN